MPRASPPREHPTRRYVEFPPPAGLGDAVECLWVFRGSADGPARHRVLPDGAADLLFDLSPPSPGARAVGTMRRPQTVPVDATTRVIGARFRPGHARGFLGIPLDELTDRVAPLGGTLGDGALRLAETTDDAVAVSAFARLLLDRAASAAPADRRVLGAVAALSRVAERPSIAAVAAGLGLSRQHLRRLVAAEVGLSPKVFVRVLRLRAALRDARLRRSDWADLAATWGYADQSHLIRDCRRLTGQTPAMGDGFHSSKTGAAASATIPLAR